MATLVLVLAAAALPWPAAALGGEAAPRSEAAPDSVEDAAQDAADDSADDSAHDSADGALVIDQVVVTASRFPELVLGVPNRAVVVEPEPAERARTADLGELLLGRCSFDVRSQGNPGAVSTISLRGSATNQVLVMVDGRPINSVTTGGANLSEVMLDQIERVEVVEGPHSHIWGSSAVGGVVNVVTRRPPEDFEARAQAAYGSENTQLYSFSAGDTVGQRFGFLLMGGVHLSDGFRPNSDLEAYNAAGKFTVEAGEVDLSLFSNVYRDEIGVPGSKPGPGEQPPLGNSEVRNLTERMRTNLVNNTLVAQTSPAEGLTVRARFFQDLRELDDLGRREFFAWDAGGAGLDPFRDEFDTLIFGGSLEAEAERGVSRLVAGFDWHHDLVEVSKQRTLAAGETLELPGFEESRTSIGFFARERLQVAGPLAVHLGARVDYDSIFGDEFSPSGGLTLNLGQTTLRGSVARVWRAPTFNELFWPNAGNPDLEPESGWGSEFGIRRELIPGRLALDVALFYWQISNKIEWRYDPNTFSFRPENVDALESSGVTVSAEARPIDSLELEAAYTYLNATQENTELDWVSFQERQVRRRADLIPRHQVTAAVAYTWETGTRVYGRLLYLSDRLSRFKPGEPLTSFVLLWAGVSQRLGERVELFFEAENLLDEDYSFQAGLPGDGDFPAPPLNFLGGVRLTY